MEELKPALTIDQQVKLLEERGIILDDESEAEQFLIKNNYYRLNIYFHKTMVSQNQFNKCVTFRQIINIYENDKWLRNKILFLLEPLEIKLKTVIAYYLGCKYGPGAFYNDQLYRDRDKYYEVCNNFRNEIDRNKSDPVVRHHKEKFGGRFPIWVIVEYFSFHTISKYYKNLLQVDKNNISNKAFELSGYYLGQWTQSLSIMRNICAHFGYLYRRSYTIAIDGGSIFRWRSNENRTLFAILQISRRLSNPGNWNSFLDQVVERSEKNHGFQLNDYGFPEDWIDHLDQL